jgi:hypothetical protein
VSSSERAPPASRARHPCWPCLSAVSAGEMTMISWTETCLLAVVDGRCDICLGMRMMGVVVAVGLHELGRLHCRQPWEARAGCPLRGRKRMS